MTAGDREPRRKPAGPSLFKVEGVDVDVEVRRNARARRFILRVDTRTRRAIVTAPGRSSASEALAFARSKRAWILGRLDEAPPPAPFANGIVFPFEGAPVSLRLEPTGRMPRFNPEQRVLHIAAAPEHLNRRTVDWLKKRARATLCTRTDHYADAIGIARGPVRVRDQRTRWGSCSSDRVLSFSWRLILAPPFVLDYVAAHECSHMRQMNHSREFWRLVDTTGVERVRAEEWLKRHGPELFQWGATAPA